MAQWAKDGSILTDPAHCGRGSARPGKVLHYILNKTLIGDDYREHVFGWLSEHHCHTLYGKPMEIWDHSQYIQDCPATFLPIHKTACRFVAGYGRVPMPSTNEDAVMFVCPLPSLGYYYSFILYVYVN